MSNNKYSVVQYSTVISRHHDFFLSVSFCFPALSQPALWPTDKFHTAATFHMFPTLIAAQTAKGALAVPKVTLTHTRVQSL